MNQPASLEETLRSQVVLLEAVVSVLEKKGLLKKADVMAEVASVRKEMEEKRRN